MTTTRINKVLLSLLLFSGAQAIQAGPLPKRTRADIEKSTLALVKTITKGVKKIKIFKKHAALIGWVLERPWVQAGLVYGLSGAVGTVQEWQSKRRLQQAENKYRLLAKEYEAELFHGITSDE